MNKVLTILNISVLLGFIISATVSQIYYHYITLQSVIILMFNCGFLGIFIGCSLIIIFNNFFNTDKIQINKLNETINNQNKLLDKYYSRLDAVTEIEEDIATPYLDYIENKGIK